MVNIFISHSSECLTNHKLHGDGLVAFEFINRLANRGHILHVAIASMDIKGEISPNIHLYPVKRLTSISTLQPLEYMIGVRRIFDQVSSKYPLDLIHQLNPVSRGKSCLLTNTDLPIVLGLFVPGWDDINTSDSIKKFSFGKIILNLTNPLINFGDRHQQKKASALLLSTLAAKSRIYNYENEQVKQKTYCIPYGIDLKHFTPQKQQNQQSLTILYLASLTHRKGIFTLLEAFEIINTKLPNCQLKIAGKGEEEEAVINKITKMSCQNQIELLGMIKREDIPTIMNNCTLYCLPSYGEPFGISAIEAMACGKPIVATNTGGLGYLIDEKGGIKVKPKDVNDLANGLLEILMSETLQTEMGEYNRKLVEQKYDWEKIIDQLESIYQKVLI